MGGYRPLTVRDELDAGVRVLAETVAGWAEKYPDVDFTAQSVPLPASRALANASEHAALVVVGPPGRPALGSLLPGSVGNAVLRHAHCSVAVAR
jgi:nucleotide-binding universal stress UspA family protein